MGLATFVGPAPAAARSGGDLCDGIDCHLIPKLTRCRYGYR